MLRNLCGWETLYKLRTSKCSTSSYINYSYFKFGSVVGNPSVNLCWAPFSPTFHALDLLLAWSLFTGLRHNTCSSLRVLILLHDLSFVFNSYFIICSLIFTIYTLCQFQPSSFGYFSFEVSKKWHLNRDISDDSDCLYFVIHGFVNVTC
jgi:hypothetical protein